MASLHWSGTALRTVLVATTDVQTWLNEIIDQITVQLPVAERWTDLGSGVYKNVPDSAGAYMTVEFLRDTALRLSIKVKDHLARTLYDGSHVILSGDTVYSYAGPNHLAAQSIPGSGGGKAFWAAMTDPSPESLGAHTARVACHIEFDSGGTANGYNTVHDGAAIDLRTGAGALSQSRIEVWGHGASGNYRQLTPDGAEFRTAVPVRNDLISSTPEYFMGMAHQLALVNVDNTANVILDVPIDIGVVGRFETLALIAAGNNASALAVRVPDNL